MDFNVQSFGAAAGSEELQTAAFQAALDAAAQAMGGRVVVPAGEYVVSSLRMYSGTTLLLCDGARLLGSRECEDYTLFTPPAGLELRTDVEMIPQHYEAMGGSSPFYRRAMISAYGQRDIAILGEGSAVIDGRDCFDPQGEEGYRGPHGIFLSGCRNVELRGYTIENSGNFMHQLDGCSNVVFESVTMLAGHDGAHIHCCDNVLFEDCTIQSGDDCIAGIDTRNVTVRRCLLNTSCHNFRIGGVNLLVEDCRLVGPGVYPHRLSVAHGREDRPAVTDGRHNTLFAFTYFSSVTHPAPTPASNWYIRNCTLENIDRFLCYHANDAARLHAGATLSAIRLENLTIHGLRMPSDVEGDPDCPLVVEARQVDCRYFSGQTADLFDGCQNVLVRPW